MIVRAQEVERRVQKACLLQAQIDGVCALQSSESARAQSLVGFPVVFILVGQPDFKATLSAALEDAQDVAGLRNLPAGKGINERENPAQRHRLRLDVAELYETFGCARFVRVAFAEARVFEREAAVVVERRAPEHR